MKFERNEYPRPQFRREEWLPLNGEWEFSFDGNGDGDVRGLSSGKIALEKKISVPFAYQYEASGIGDLTVCDTVWYRREFILPKTEKRALLCFNGSDYVTDVWVNGFHVCKHTGAYAPFNADITKYLSDGTNVIVVRCIDTLDLSVPRGKQSWTGKRFACWYYPTTGIWQSVWIEFFGEDAINSYSIIPDIDKGTVFGQIETYYGIADELEIVVKRMERIVNQGRFAVKGKTAEYNLSVLDHNTLDKLALWSPERPHLYDIEFTLYKNGNVIDKASSRFGMRKISIDKFGKICLNNKPYYQRLILDQGYWKESGTTPPSVEALKKDIELCKAMGFNGARKHQKMEDPYWYYLADELGFLTWCEMPSAYDFCEREILSVTKEWMEIVSIAKNFTSVIAYVPFNESWGIRQVLTDKRQQNFAGVLYYVTKTLDNARLVSTNDGWENTQITDFISVHDYAYDDTEFQKKYIDGKVDEVYPAGRKLMVEGANYCGHPILFTEFGGVAMKTDSGGGNWGYGEGAADAEAFYRRIAKLVKGVYSCPFQGYCYTQLSDVQQEVNGLLDENHEPKFDVNRLKEIFEGKQK
ncbi:MAG: glycoside hydrolase family 2 TIM barrel-domain containing protein [Candidatus Borkfalkiaceae bacterium]|nr:glycoside hydrolase family 2 TIM barrel-domain containing protein [Clostridia bacterium]MDY6222749.1 glycoside hydrolase family 2 TIM barrel-domain containing protein [Christensenellaceae bacterium]